MKTKSRWETVGFCLVKTRMILTDASHPTPHHPRTAEASPHHK